MDNSIDLGQTAKEIQRSSRYLKKGIFASLLSWFCKNLSRIHRRLLQRKKAFKTTVLQSTYFEDAKHVEIIIPIYGPSELLERCLESIQNSRGIDASVILIDNGASQSVREAIDSNANVDKVIVNKENLGFGEACNQGISQATGEYIILMNSDIVVRVDSIRILLDEIEKNSKIGLCSSVLINDFGRIEEAGRVLTTQANAVALYENAREVDLPVNGVSAVPYASFACVALRRSAYLKTNGFDPFFAPAYSEDVDLSIELLKIGYVSIISYSSRVLHIQGLSSADLPDLLDIKDRNRIYLLKKQEQFFRQIALTDNHKEFPHQLTRARISNMRSRKLFICPDARTFEELCEFVHISKKETIFHYVGLILTNVNGHYLTDPSSLTNGDFESQGIDLLLPEKSSTTAWFRDRICSFDEVVCFSKDFELIDEDLTSLIRDTQPQALFRFFDS